LGTAGAEQTFEKACMTARNSGSIESIYVVFYSVIFIHQLDIIRKEYIICLQISQLQYKNIIILLQETHQEMR